MAPSPSHLTLNLRCKYTITRGPFSHFATAVSWTKSELKASSKIEDCHSQILISRTFSNNSQTTPSSGPQAGSLNLASSIPSVRNRTISVVSTNSFYWAKTFTSSLVRSSTRDEESTLESVMQISPGECHLYSFTLLNSASVSCNRRIPWNSYIVGDRA